MPAFQEVPRFVRVPAADIWRFLGRLIERSNVRFFAGATSFAVTATFMIVFIRTPLTNKR